VFGHCLLMLGGGELQRQWGLNILGSVLRSWALLALQPGGVAGFWILQGNWFGFAGPCTGGLATGQNT
jgi:hypothetical protein